MIRLLATVLLGLCLTASGAFATSLDDLYQVDGLWHKKFTDEPFTGKLDEGQHRGEIKNGTREGPWVVYWDDGTLKAKGSIKNGKHEGPWVWFVDDGTKIEIVSGTYRDGKKISD